MKNITLEWVAVLVRSQHKLKVGFSNESPTSAGPRFNSLTIVSIHPTCGTHIANLLQDIVAFVLNQRTKASLALKHIYN
jgi:hypothetical protein